jgi:hypothetical protein
MVALVAAAVSAACAAILSCQNILIKGISAQDFWVASPQQWN